MHAKNYLGRQGLTQKPSKTLKAYAIGFLIFSDLQKLPISPYSFSYNFFVSTGYSKIERHLNIPRYV